MARPRFFDTFASQLRTSLVQPEGFPIKLHTDEQPRRMPFVQIRPTALPPDLGGAADGLMHYQVTVFWAPEPDVHTMAGLVAYMGMSNSEVRQFGQIVAGWTTSEALPFEDDAPVVYGAQMTVANPDAAVGQ